MNLKKEYLEAMNYTNYLQLLEGNLELHHRHYKKFQPEHPFLEKIKRLRKLKILTITEPWCGDSLALLPVVRKIAEIHGDWEMKISLRDATPGLIEKFLTDGSKSIPIFLFLDENYKLVFKWGPRPAEMKNFFAEHRDKIKNGEIEKAEVIKKIRTFYARDRGQTTITELIKAFEFNGIYSN